MKPGTNPRKLVTIPAYCRVCWKRLHITLDIYGMTKEEIVKHCNWIARCCVKPDLRVNL